MPVLKLHPAIQGSIASPLDFTGINALGLHTNEATQRYVCGQRLITDDGRLYKYCLSTTGGVDGYHGCKSLSGDVIGEVLTAAAPSGAAAIGDTQIYITETGFTKNQLIGSYIFVYDTSGGGQFRYVSGNDASITSKTKLYVSEPWDQTIAGTEYCEMFYNPYILCTKTATGKASTVAVPACTAVASRYFWGQTWGPCVISPGHTITPSSDERQLGFGTNNAVFLDSAYPDDGLQAAGFVMNYNSDDGPLTMLKISV